MTLPEIERLIADAAQESQTLEFKRAKALGRDSPQRAELVKDVTAMANAAGGRIIYGMLEEEQGDRKVTEKIVYTIALQAYNDKEHPRLAAREYHKRQQPPSAPAPAKKRAK